MVSVYYKSDFSLARDARVSPSFLFCSVRMDGCVSNTSSNFPTLFTIIRRSSTHLRRSYKEVQAGTRILSSSDKLKYKGLIDFLKQYKIIVTNSNVPFTKSENEIFEFIDFVQGTPEQVCVKQMSLNRWYTNTRLLCSDKCLTIPSVLLYQRERKEFILANANFLYVRLPPGSRTRYFSC